MIDNWFTRLRTEKAELDARIYKLHVFMHSAPYKDLSDQDQQNLCSQLGVMLQYSSVLNARIVLAGGAESQHLDA